MQDVVVRYRTRSISSFMLVVFVLFLLLPASFAVIAASAASVRGTETANIGKVIKISVSLFGIAAIAFSPPTRVTIDRSAGVLRHTTGWRNKLITELPLTGLRGVTVEPHRGGSLFRLSLIYLDAAQRPLSDSFFYGKVEHERVAQALTAAIVAHNVEAAA